MRNPGTEWLYPLEWERKDTRWTDAMVELRLKNRLKGAGMVELDVAVQEGARVSVRFPYHHDWILTRAQGALELSGFGLHVAASPDEQEVYRRNRRLPPGFRRWDNPKPMAGDYAAYGAAVLLSEPPLLTADEIESVSCEKKTEPGSEGWTVWVQYSGVSAGALDRRAMELFKRIPRGLLGVTWSGELRGLYPFASDRFHGKVPIPVATEEEARRLSAYLSSGYLPARLGPLESIRSIEWIRESRRGARTVAAPSLSGEAEPAPDDPVGKKLKHVRETFAKGDARSLAAAYIHLFDFVEMGILDEGLTAFEESMKRCQRTSDIDREWMEDVRWLAKLMGNPRITFPERYARPLILEDRSALVILADQKIRILDPNTESWIASIPLVERPSVFELSGPRRLLVKAARNLRKGTLAKKTVDVERSEEEYGPLSVEILQCRDAGFILGSCRDFETLVYRTSEEGKIGVLGLRGVKKGTHSVALTFLTLDTFRTFATWAYVSPGGERVLVTTYDAGEIKRNAKRMTQYFQLIDTKTDTLLGTIKGWPGTGYTFSWSPDGRWIAGHSSETQDPDWDVPVGSTLTDYVRLYDGFTAEEKWHRKARHHGDFGWTIDGRVQCEGKIWDPESPKPDKP